MLLQAEQMHKMTTISLKKVEVHVILSENSCHFVSCSACKISICSQLEISHMLDEPTAKNQHKCRGPQWNDSNVVDQRENLAKATTNFVFLYLCTLQKL